MILRQAGYEGKKEELQDQNSAVEEHTPHVINNRLPRSNTWSSLVVATLPLAFNTRTLGTDCRF